MVMLLLHVALSSTPSTQIQALHDLYNSTNGVEWNWHGGVKWDFSLPTPCISNWAYITCDANMNITSVIGNETGINMIGTLPPSIGNLSTLQILSFQHNPHLDGTLPDSLGSLSNLTSLVLTQSGLNGRIPSSLENLRELQYLVLSDNFLTSTVPPAIMISLRKLVQLNLANNYLSGFISPSYFEMPNLESLLLHRNLFQSTLPFNIGYGPKLSVLVLSENQLYGSIPPSLMNSTSLVAVYLGFNELNGSIPSIPFNTVTPLTFLTLNSNNLFGELPSSLVYAKNLANIYLDSNRFTGSLPSTWGDLSELILFSVGNNSLSGSIPVSYGQLKKLEIFNVSSNKFSGSIGSTVSSLTSLSAVYLQNNRFVGTLDGLVDPTLQLTLETIDLSNNAFSSSIPDSIFQLPKLSIIAAVKNCLEGSLPNSVCLTNRTLQVIALDGLFSATTCISRIFPELPQVRSFTLRNPLEGSVPSCLFTDFKELTTIHLSGNGIRGSIPNIVNITSPKLMDLVLSHNRLTSTIPLAVQRHKWSDLDLSFNKLTGYLDDRISSFEGVDDSLKLTINRLSGGVPSNLRNAVDINILTGNMFSCDSKKTNLPKHDKTVESYECGSNSINDALIGWLVITMAIFMIVLIVLYRKFCYFPEKVLKFLNKLERSVLSYWELYTGGAAATFYDQPLEELNELGVVYREVRRWCVRLTAIMLVVFLPVYPSLSKYYGSYAKAYAWSVSLGYITGETPAVVGIVLLSLFLTSIYFRPLVNYNKANVYYLLARMTVKAKKIYKANFIRQLSKNTEENRNSKKNKSKYDSFRSKQGSDEMVKMVAHCIWYTRITLLLLINASVVLAVNMSYIYAISTSLSGIAKQIIAFGISLYKLAWNEVVILAFEMVKRNQFSSGRLNVILKNMVDKNIEEHDLANVEMEGNVYSVLAANMTWLSIFNNIIAPFIAVAFISPDCFYYTIYPAQSVEATYSINACDFGVADSGQIIYDCRLLRQSASTSYTPPFIYSYQCSSTLLTSFAEIFIYRYVIGSIVIPLGYLVLKLVQEYAFKRYGGKDSRLYRLATAALPSPLRPSAFLPVEKPSIVCGIESKFLNLESLMVNLITDIAIMLTFGAVFPPLAIVGCISVIITTYFTQLQLGRVVVLARTQDYLQEYLDRIISECSSVRGLLVHSLKSLSVLLAAFWSLFLFDAWGDKNGLLESIWVIIFMPTIPGFIAAGNIAYNSMTQKSISLLKNNESVVPQSYQDRDSNAFAVSESAPSGQAIIVHNHVVVRPGEPTDGGEVLARRGTLEVEMGRMRTGQYHDQKEPSTMNPMTR